MDKMYGIPDQTSVSKCIRIILFAIAIFLCLGTAPAAAHPPSLVIPEYDGTTGLLSITITHEVPNPEGHYIGNVQVSVNGLVVNESSYTGQPSADSFTYTYPLIARPGDAIEVIAHCNLAGSGTGKLTVPGSGGTAGETSATQAAGGIAPAVLAGAILVLAKPR